jgi:hypothetical protein
VVTGFEPIRLEDIRIPEEESVQNNLFPSGQVLTQNNIFPSGQAKGTDAVAAARQASELAAARQAAAVAAARQAAITTARPQKLKASGQAAADLTATQQQARYDMASYFAAGGVALGVGLGIFAGLRRAR